MADNLTIQIGADTSKLRADLAIAQAQVKLFGAELRAEATASLTSGDATGVGALAARYDAAAINAARLKKEISGVHEEEKGLSIARALRQGAEGFEAASGRFRGGVEGLFSNLPVSGGGLAAAAGVAIAGALVEAGVRAAEEAHELSAMSVELGISTGQMHAWRVAFGQAGVSADLLVRAMYRLSISAEKAGEAQRKLAVDDAKILADDSGVVMRGGSHSAPPPLKSPLIDPSARPKIDDPKFQEFAGQRYELEKQAQEQYRNAGQSPPALAPFKTFLDTLANRMEGTDKGAEQLRQDFAKQGGNAPVQSMTEALNRLMPKFKDDFSEIGISVLDASGKLRNMADIAGEAATALAKLRDEGKDAEANKFSQSTMSKAARDPIFQEKFAEEGRKNAEADKSIAASGPPLAGSVFNTPPSVDAELKNAEELYKKGEKARFDAEEAIRSGALKVDQGVANVADAIKRANDSTNQFAHVVVTADEAVAPVASAFDGLAAAAKDAATALDAVKSGGGGSAAPGSAAAPFTAPVPAAPSLGRNIGDGGANTPSAFAAGGHIRGAGSGTSDSILARVSHGEYVLRAAAVDSIGVGTLDRMNATGFAMGGLVGALDRVGTLPAFAGGGAVSGGQPVHLHLGNQAFPLSGKESVVGALVAEAHRQQMTSAGVKPSWLAGRPSGR